MRKTEPNEYTKTSFIAELMKIFGSIIVAFAKWSLWLLRNFIKLWWQFLRSPPPRLTSALKKQKNYESWVPLTAGNWVMKATNGGESTFKISSIPCVVPVPVPRRAKVEVELFTLEGAENSGPDKWDSKVKIIHIISEKWRVLCIPRKIGYKWWQREAKKNLQEGKNAWRRKWISIATSWSTRDIYLLCKYYSKQ